MPKAGKVEPWVSITVLPVSRVNALVRVALNVCNLKAHPYLMANVVMEIVAKILTESSIHILSHFGVGLSFLRFIYFNIKIYTYV